jgi:hypothetical protein
LSEIEGCQKKSLKKLKKIIGENGWTGYRLVWHSVTESWLEAKKSRTVRVRSKNKIYGHKEVRVRAEKHHAFPHVFGLQQLLVNEHEKSETVTVVMVKVLVSEGESSKITIRRRNRISRTLQTRGNIGKSVDK